jgi:lysozyme family protein
MQSNWPKSIAWILQWEGSDVNVSKTEPDGISKYGVSLAALIDFCHAESKPKPQAIDVANLTEADATAFYAWYLQPMFNAMPAGVDYRLADITVNLGRTGGALAYSTVMAGFGGKTATPDEIITALGAYWIGKKTASTAWKVDGPGWTNRFVAANANARTLIA